MSFNFPSLFSIRPEIFYKAQQDTAECKAYVYSKVGVNLMQYEYTNAEGLVDSGIAELRAYQMKHNMPVSPAEDLSSAEENAAALRNEISKIAQPHYRACERMKR